MDSLTQFVLGAAIGESVAGKRMGRTAAWVGGVVATLPDLDVLVPMADAVRAFTYHRSASHSLLVLCVVAPVLAWMLSRWLPLRMRDFRCWLWVCLLALLTHPLLDAMTIYGTQLLWPLTEHPFAVGSMFIIDPVYTVPLLLAVVVAQWRRREPGSGVRFCRYALVFSSAYLGLSVVLMQYASGVFDDALVRDGIKPRARIVMATPFNTIAWRVVAVTEADYYVGYYSLVAPAPVTFAKHPNDAPLLEPIANTWAVKRLLWFTKGIYAVGAKNGQVVLSDLRMGLEPDHYVFSFAVGKTVNGEITPGSLQRVTPEPYGDEDWRALRQRILGAVAGSH